MEFEKRKASTLASLATTETDKSPKGSIDIPIIPLLKTLNLHPSYFTTSSCSGRISILSQPSIATTPSKKARGGSWIFISHDPVDPTSVLDLVFPSESTHPPIDPHELVFRFEPLIIAVECKDVSSAQALVSLAISSGFRESGITNSNKRVIVAIRCSIRLEVPLGDTSRIMVSPEYVRYLVELANEKMKANRKRTDGFFQALLGNGFCKEIQESCNVEAKDAGESGPNGSIMCNEDGNCCSMENEYANSSRFDGKSQNGSLEVPDCRLTITRPTIVGEPVEKLFLWSHSACTLPNSNKVIVFGGFGGMGRHSRRNECLQFDPICSTLKALEVENAPSPRLGHTASLVEDFMYVIGGRADPLNILNETWLFNTSNNKWRLLECTGTVFPPRHRHASAVVGSRIYVFGGLNNDTLSSSLHVLDTNTLTWSEISMRGEWPSARHSHSLVAYGSHLYMFGGYNGDISVDDLFSFDVQTCLWKKEKMAGRTPYARFSHSMFVCEHYIGIIGGCPVKQHHQELALLDMQSLSWKHVILSSVNKNLLVRSTAAIVGDHLVMIGGGAACYAFGTSFSEPVIIDMLPLLSSKYLSKPSESKQNIVSGEIKSDCLQNKQNGTAQNLAPVTDLESEREIDAFHWVLQLEKKYAKLLKDLLKKFGWLDLRRKVYTSVNKIHICFPVTNKFHAVFHDAQHLFGDTTEVHNDTGAFKSLATKGLSLNDVSCSTCLNILKGCGATLVVDEAVKFKKTTSSPLKVMADSVASLIESRDLSRQLLEQLPTRWERIGDVVVLPSTSFKDSVWDSIGEELWLTIAKSLGTCRLARQGRIAPNGTRDSTLEILVGDNGWVEHRENEILYSFDATKCMFSWGNLSEKLRMASLDCKDEVIVDLFCGIGYFTLPFLVRAKAKYVYACEWNPHAIEALRHNLQANSVADRCIILEGDNRITVPKGVADRVCLGLLPTSEGSWVTAVRALRNEGGTLHVHGNVKDSEEESWRQHVSKSILEIATSEGHCWEVSIQHVERVKWYAPHIRHLVADVRCRQTGI